MIYTVYYVDKSRDKDGKDTSSFVDAQSYRIVAPNATSAISRFLKETEKAKSDVKIVEVRLGVV